MKKVAIVGTGMEGNFVAHELAKQGIEATVVVADKDRPFSPEPPELIIPVKPYHAEYIDNGPYLTGREKRRERRKQERKAKKHNLK